MQWKKIYLRSSTYSAEFHEYFLSKHFSLDAFQLHLIYTTALFWTDVKDHSLDHRCSVFKAPVKCFLKAEDVPVFHDDLIQNSTMFDIEELLTSCKPIVCTLAIHWQHESSTFS